MGSFSFLCQQCSKGVESNAFDGEHCELHLLDKGKTVQVMSGKYDSYGRVFEPDSDSSTEWDIGWDAVCSLMFADNTTTGMAAIHTRCMDGKFEPEYRSKQDPNQGWGSDEDALIGGSDEEDYYDDLNDSSAGLHSTGGIDYPPIMASAMMDLHSKIEHMDMTIEKVMKLLDDLQKEKQ